MEQARSASTFIYERIVVAAKSFVGSGLLASRIAREGRLWRAAAVGAGAEVGMVFAAILVAGTMLLGPGCQRPPV